MIIIMRISFAFSYCVAINNAHISTFTVYWLFQFSSNNNNTTSQADPNNLVEERLMLWLYALHSNYRSKSKWIKINSTELASCTYMHSHCTLKTTLYNKSNTIQPWGFYKQRGAAVPLVLYLEMKNIKSAKYIKTRPKIRKSLHNSWRRSN